MYNPDRNSITKSLDLYFIKYDKLMVIRYLNAEIKLECVKLSCKIYDSNIRIKLMTCQKNLEKP